MNNAYQKDMKRYHQAIKRFEAFYPQHARALSLQADDENAPNVAHLLEGMAYLTSQVREHVDNDLIDATENLLRQVMPSLLQGRPSMTIVQAGLKSNASGKAQFIDAGSEVRSAPVGDENTICQFKTMHPVLIQPISIAGVKAQVFERNKTLVTLHLKTIKQACFNELDLSSLDFHLTGMARSALDLYKVLLSHVDKVEVDFVPYTRAQVIGGQGIVKPKKPGPSRDDSFASLKDYFFFRSKHLFVTLGGLKEISWPDSCHDMLVRFYCHAPILGSLEDAFQLHCVPAINLFDTNAEPIVADLRHIEHVIQPDLDRPHSVKIHSLDRVESVDPLSGKKGNYEDAYSFRVDQEHCPRYQLLTRDQKEGFPRHYISITQKEQIKKEILSCKITASNGYYPRMHLHEHSLDNTHAPLSSQVELTNITKPTELILPLHSSCYQWELVSLLSLHYGCILDVERLKKMLSIVIGHDEDDCQKKIDSIQSVENKPINTVRRGCFVRGMELVFKINESSFCGAGDLFLFGEVLHAFMACNIPMNTAMGTRIVALPSEKEFVWDINH